ncbi:MAG: VOC family protein [Alphaproteobacteria bacterium]|nr:VOC family protein [Alphaproteobacteria bacterium]
MSQTVDQRPPVAVGHVWLPATDVTRADQWLQSVGLRRIFADGGLAVLELRGGTHVVVRKADQPPAEGAAAPFDLMVDDIEAARRDYAAKGLAPSEISRGRIHDSFHLTGPDGYDFTVTSSHAGGRAV